MANQVVLGAPGAVSPCPFQPPGGSSVSFRQAVSFPVLGPVSLRSNPRYVIKCRSSGPVEDSPRSYGGNSAEPSMHYPGKQGYGPGGGSPSGYNGSPPSTGYVPNASYPGGAGGNTPGYTSNPSPPNPNADYGWRKGMNEPSGGAPSGPGSYAQPNSAQGGGGYNVQSFTNPVPGKAAPSGPPGSPVYAQPNSAQGGGGYNAQGSTYPGPGTGVGAPPPHSFPNASPGGYGTPASSPSAGFGAPAGYSPPGNTAQGPSAGYNPPPPGNTAQGPSTGHVYGRAPPAPATGNYAGTGARSSYNAPRGQGSYTPRGSPAAKPPSKPMPEFKLPDGTNKWTSVDEMRRHYFPNAENEPPPKRTYKTPDPAAGGFVIPDGSRKWNSIDEMRKHYFPNEDFSQPPKRTYKAPDPKAGGFVLPDGSRKWNSIDEMRRHYFPNEDFSKPPKPFGSSNKAGGDKV